MNGETQTINRKKPLRTPAEIAARVANKLAPLPVVPGVTPLNSGYFQLQQMRDADE